MDKPAVKEEMSESMVALINAIDDKIISFSKNKGKVTDDDFRWAFQNALTFEEYLRTFKDRLAASATTYAPAALASVGKQAAQGNIKAAKLIFDVIGSTKTPGGSGSVNMTQVNVTVPTLKDLEEGSLVDVSER